MVSSILRRMGTSPELTISLSAFSCTMSLRNVSITAMRFLFFYGVLWCGLGSVIAAEPTEGALESRAGPCAPVGPLPSPEVTTPTIMPMNRKFVRKISREMVPFTDLSLWSLS